MKYYYAKYRDMFKDDHDIRETPKGSIICQCRDEQTAKRILKFLNKKWWQFWI